MQISLRQTGGVFGGDQQVNISEKDLQVTRNGTSATRTLTDDECAVVDDIATRLISAAPSTAYPGDEFASDSMVTEVEIGRGRNRRRYEVRSGSEAPTELWELVGKLSEVADAPVPEG